MYFPIDEPQFLGYNVSEQAKGVRMSVEKMTNSKYHKIKALSHSLLVKAKLNPMYAYVNSIFNPDYVDVRDNDALVFGNLYHALVRLPQLIENRQQYIDKFESLYEKYEKIKEYNKGKKDKDRKAAELPIVEIQYDDGKIVIADFGLTRRNKAYDEVMHLVNAQPDDLIVSLDEFKRACDQARCLHVHPIYQQLHAGAEVLGDEICIIREMDGYSYKCKLDRLIKKGDRYIILDWKGTKEMGVSTMQNVGQRMGYDIQDELYKKMVALEYDVPIENVDMVFFLQCKDLPLTMFAFEFGPESILQARTDREMAADDFMMRLNRNTGLAGFMPVQTEIMRFKHYENAFVDFTPIN